MTAMLELRAVALALFLSMASMAYADNDDYINSDRPGIAESSEVVGPGRLQLEIGVQRETRRTGDAPERSIFLPTLLRLGIGERWEARLEGDVYAWMRSSGADGGRAEAAAPASLGFKYRFQEAESGWPSLGIIALISPPSGSKTLRTRRATGEVRLVADWELTPKWSLNPNLGLAIDEDDAGRRFSAAMLAATLAYRPAARLELFVDAAVQRPEAKGAGSGIIYDAGLAYLVGRDVQLDLSFGTRGAGAAPPRSFVAAGVSVRF